MEDVRPDLQAASQSVIYQLDGRLRGDLSEADKTAVATAVHHALYRGFRLGFDVARVTYRDQLAELGVRVDGKTIEIPPPVILDDEDAEVDLWLERYGDDDA